MRKFALAAPLIGIACLTGFAASAGATIRPARVVMENPVQSVEYVCRGDRCWWRGPRHRRGLNEFGCPYGYTIQGGVCKPYRGPTVYDYGYGPRYLPCGRPGWTVQDGVCKPYRGF